MDLSQKYAPAMSEFVHKMQVYQRNDLRVLARNPFIIGRDGSGKTLFKYSVARFFTDCREDDERELHSIDPEKFNIDTAAEDVLENRSANFLIWGREFVVVERANEIPLAGQQRLAALFDETAACKELIWIVTAQTLSGVDFDFANRFAAFDINPKPLKLIEYTCRVCVGENVAPPADRRNFVKAAYGSYAALNKLLGQHIERRRSIAKAA
jgi:hypothetical protein